MPRTRSKETSDHRDFEAYVAFLYESLGFKVTRNILLGGQEVDVLAERFFPGVGRTRIAVECKWRSSGSISNQHVHDFSTAVSSLRNKQLITRGVMVTNTRYSPDAQAARDGDEAVELLTIVELEDHLFDVRHVLSAYVENYQKSAIFTSYVPLRAAWRKPFSTHGNTSEDIEATLLEWLQQDNFGLVSILGDYGTGKTTLMGRLKYIVSQRYLAGDSLLLPLLLPLKRFYGHDNIDDFLKSLIVSEFERDLPLAVLWRAIAEGRFLLLLDGFDEMAVEADIEKRSESFLLLSPLLGSGSKVVLTCRPAYFVKHSEYESLILSLNRVVEPMAPAFDEPSIITSPKYPEIIGSARRLKHRIISRISGYQPIVPLPNSRIKLVELELFDEKQIDLFLSKFDDDYRRRFRENWRGVKAFMLGIYDLSDLMSRPILLTMINETILDGRIRIGSNIVDLGPSSIYELYTSAKLDLDWLKGESRRLLTKDDRAAFAETIAVAMYLKGTLEINYTELLALAEQEAGLPTKTEYLRNIRASVVASDLQVSTFLTRSEDEVFRFAHKSFVEFYVALNLKKKLLRRERRAFSEKVIPKEILYFLGGFSIPEPTVRETLVQLYSSQDQGPEGLVALRNLAAAILYSGPRQHGLRLENTEISSIDVKKVRFDAPSWKKVKFMACSLSDMEMSSGSLDEITLETSSINRLSLDQGTYNLRLTESTISGLESHSATISINATGSQLLSSKAEGGRIQVSGSLAIARVHCSEIILKIGIATKIKIEDCNFRHSALIFNGRHYAHDSLRLINCSFLECGIFGVRLPENNWENYVNQNLRGCKGVVIVDNPKDEVTEEKRILVVKQSVWLDPVARRDLLVRHQSWFNKRWLDELFNL